MSPAGDEVEGTVMPEAGAETAPQESADMKKRRPRGSRGRRGGRKRSTRETPGGELGQAPQGSNSEALTVPEAEAEGNGMEDGADSATNGEGASRKRRRRGRRGGRRHKGSRSPRDGTLGAPDDAPLTGSDPAPAAAGPTGPPDE
jgi:ribonuclease E